MSQTALTSPLQGFVPTRLFHWARTLSSTRTAVRPANAGPRVEAFHRQAPTAQSLEVEMLRAQARIFQALR